MATIEIVAHCYCPPGVPFYAQCLKWQWASLVNCPCDHTVEYTVCYTNEDRETVNRLSKCMSHEPDNIYLRPLRLAPQQLFRRAIGRNLRALNTDADIVWFTDIDYLFGWECLNTVASLVEPDDKLCMPESYYINIDHKTGDSMLQRFANIDYPNIPANLFQERNQRIPIGGLQIVGGNFAREVGYLKDTKYVEPVMAHFGFRSCKCDRWYRKENNLKATRLAIPNVYRIRHTVDGRDFFADGTKGKGKEAW